MSRSAEIIRNTSETKIKLFIDLDAAEPLRWTQESVFRPHADQFCKAWIF